VSEGKLPNPIPVIEKFKLQVVDGSETTAVPLPVR
jgi:hypothetical protein